MSLKIHFQEMGYVPWRHLYYTLLRNDVNKDVPVESHDFSLVLSPALPTVLEESGLLKQTLPL